MTPEETLARIEELEAQVATLEHLLEVHERVSAEQNENLQKARVEALALAEQAKKSEEAKSELVERLRIAVDDLSTPVLEVWDDVLALPIVGLVDSSRASQIMERLLDEIVAKQATFVIIDVTGVEVIDSRTAEHFTKLVKAVELIGARCVLTGIRPAVGQTLLDLGLELGNVRTLRNLKHALRATLRQVRSSKAKRIKDDAELWEE